MELQIKALDIRERLLEMIHAAGAGHTGGALSCTDILVALYYGVLRQDPSHPDDPGRDRFILSKGHSVEGYYAILADLGYISQEELRTFCQCRTRLGGHPNRQVPGIEVSTGALGHGLPIGVGLALAAQRDGSAYRTYVLMGDGELAEGSVWEAAMAASTYGLDNLIAIVDRNHLQISGNTEQVMQLEPLKERWQAFGWHVLLADGHDLVGPGGILAALKSLPRSAGKPHVILADTVKGKGVPAFEGVAHWHHGVPSEAQMACIRQDFAQQRALLKGGVCDAGR